MSRSRSRFTLAEWTAIVAVAALILARGTWLFRHGGSEWLGVEAVLVLGLAGVTVT